MLFRRCFVRTVLTLALLLAMASSSGAAYTVRAGDTLSGIAQRLGVALSSLVSANGIADPDYVREGAVLTVPAGGVAATGGSTRVVRAGETLWGIATQTGVSVSTIAAANGLGDGARIYAGQTLRIPTAGVAPAPAQQAVNPARADVGTLIGQTAATYGVDASLMKALAYLESGWNNAVVSADGAVGIMQVLPSTGEFVSRYLVGRSLDLNDPADNVEAGVAFMRYLLRLTGGDVERSLAGYYQGLRSVAERGYYDDTKRYIANVQYLRNRF